MLINIILNCYLIVLPMGPQCPETGNQWGCGHPAWPYIWPCHSKMAALLLFVHPLLHRGHAPTYTLHTSKFSAQLSQAPASDCSYRRRGEGLPSLLVSLATNKPTWHQSPYDWQPPLSLWEWRRHCGVSLQDHASDIEVPPSAKLLMSLLLTPGFWSRAKTSLAGLRGTAQHPSTLVILCSSLVLSLSVLFPQPPILGLILCLFTFTEGSFLFPPSK